MIQPFQQLALDRQKARKAAGAAQRYPQHAKARPTPTKRASVPPPDGIQIRVSGCKLRPCTWTWAVIENGVAIATGKAQSEAEARAEAEEARRDRESQA